MQTSSLFIFFLKKKVFGHEKVSILSGGLPEWIQENYPIENTLVIEYFQFFFLSFFSFFLSLKNS